MHPSIDSSITFLRVVDLEVSHEFYERGLGLDLVLDQGGCRIYRLTADSYVGVCERADSQTSDVIVTIVTDEVDRWHQDLADRGVAADGPPRSNDEYGIYHFFVTDPDGNLIEVQRFLDPRWAKAGS